MNKISKREKILLVILLIMIVGGAYYMFFLTPSMETKEELQAEITAMDDQVIMAQAQVTHIKKMQEELEAIKAKNTNIKEVPAFDNSKKLMESLNLMLSSAVEYTVNFSGTGESDGMVRRNVSLNYQCFSYDLARAILQSIHDGKYPCVLQDVSLSYDELYSVAVTLTFFEYVE